MTSHHSGHSHSPRGGINGQWLAMCVLAAAGVAVAATNVRAQQAPPVPAPPAIAEQVDVIGVTPIHGIGLPLTLVPSNVQVFTTADVSDRLAFDAPSLLLQRAASVHTSEAQGGTYQPDLLFRGFTASPLLGASEGLAIYLDGVRINDPFGDTIAWDVLPMAAVASINVMPGSNPLFGLNALGGALSLQTKDGFTAPTRQFTYTGGAFGRHRVEAEAGGRGTSWGYYVAGTLLRDSGWRDFSPSIVRRLFGDLAWRDGTSSVNISVTAAANDITGNGAVPVALLEQDRSAVFTHPDETRNDVALVTVRGRRPLGTGLLLDGVAYYRRGDLNTFNGDDADDDAFDDDDTEVEEDEDDEFDAVNNLSRTLSHGAGVTGQVTRTAPLAGRASHFVAGAGIDAASTRFGFASEHAFLTPDRGTVGTGLFDEDAAVDLRTRIVTGSAFVSETWSLTRRVSLTGSARVNWTSLQLRDQLGTDLDGDHTFARVNPAAGVTVQAAPGVNLYGSYAQSSRVPSPVELTCADPEDPCRLPNAFVSDPPLEQIVASTWEAGIRRDRGPLNWTLAAFRSAASDDIIFVSSGTLRGQGHFENVPRTRRTGVEAMLEYDVTDRVGAFAAYTGQRAEFGSDLRVASPMHPDARGTEIAVSDGDRLPGVPSHTAKAGLVVRPLPRLQAGLDVYAQSGVVLRGDESNQLPRVPGFARVDLRGRYRLTARLTLLAQLHNLLDTDYATFGILGDADLIDDDLTDRRFFSPGEPRGAWVGVEVRF